jgi:alpha-L-arabinofuranosidase
MRKLFLTFLGAGAIAMLQAQTTGPVQIQVNASKPVARVTKLFNGSNIEDLNNQTNGGIFSQLLHGEAFEENVDIDFLKLPVGDYVKVYVILDEMRRPHFLSTANAYTRPVWNNLTEKYDFNSKDIYAMVNPIVRSNPNQDQPPRPVRPMEIGPLKFYGRFMPYDSIPESIKSELLKRINGNDQISRYWTKISSGNVTSQYELRRGDAYQGRQNQIIRFVQGTGECGLINSGLNKQGIDLVSGKPYDGVIRIKSSGATTVFLSLRDEKGALLAEKPYNLRGDGTYEKLQFELTPSGSTPRGSFGITLKSRGEIELGFAFMQPGSWGRVNNLPVRKMFADALIKQGITVIRYNGSMVDVGADTYLYRWKKMIGPVDERRVSFRSGFNPYATHSFGVVEMAQVAEAIGAIAMIGMSMDETYEDIRDFVEYMNGPVSTKWGKLRADHGHPAPYNLKYIQVDNERPMTRGYVECMKKFALAAWEVDPEMHIMTSLNIGTNLASYARGTEQYNLSSELFGWFIAQGKGDRMVWDPHYSGARSFADHEGFTNEMGIVLQTELEKDYPGHKLVLTPMEENGSRCDWDRGLAHAHNWNTLQRYGNHFRALGTANTFQPHGQHYMWDQGRVHYTTNEIWFQPSAYIDEKMTTDWLPIVVEATTSNDKFLDVTAKINEKGDSLSIYVVNLTDQPQKAVMNVADFRFSGRAGTWVIGDCDLNTLNTVDNKLAVAPKTGTMTFARRNAEYTFPRYSYTIITLKR